MNVLATAIVLSILYHRWSERTDVYTCRAVECATEAAPAANNCSQYVLLLPLHPSPHHPSSPIHHLFKYLLFVVSVHHLNPVLIISLKRYHP